MKNLIVSLAAAAALAPAAYASEISIEFSPEFQKKLEKDYGTAEGEKLTKDVREDIERELSKANIDPASVKIVIVDAKPNRPTFKQLGDTPGLDAIRSKSIGGMDLKGTAYSADGSALAELEYDWYETNIEMTHAAGVWSDAKRASRRFAKKLADELSD